jgi:hypothetical protein
MVVGSLPKQKPPADLAMGKQLELSLELLLWKRSKIGTINIGVCVDEPFIV